MDEIDEKVEKTEGEPEKGSLFSRIKEKRQKKQEEKSSISAASIGS